MIDLLVSSGIVDNSCDPFVIGAKAANLRRVRRLGVSVPKAEIISPKLVKEWLHHFPEYTEVMESWRLWKKGRYPDSLARFCDSLLELPVPDFWFPVHEKILKLLNRDSARLIFRSNMSAEDGASSSFAGSYKSIVLDGLVNREKSWQCFITVIASAYSESAAMRVLEAGVSPHDFAPGVLIQPFIDAEISGVCFTRHPESLFESPADGYRDFDLSYEKFGLVDWASGSCQGVVDGVVESSSLQFDVGLSPEKAIPEKLKLFWGGLKKLAIEIDAEFSGPADIEWIWDGSLLWVVQVRPVVSSLAILAKNTPKGHYWTREESHERFPDPITPISWSSLSEVLRHNIQMLGNQLGVVARNPENVAICHHGLVYTDPKFFSFPSGMKIKLAHFLAPWKKSSWKINKVLLVYISRRVFHFRKKMTNALLRLEMLDSTLRPMGEQIYCGWDEHKSSSSQKLNEFIESLSEQNEVGLSAEKIPENIEKIQSISKEFLKSDLLIFIIKDSIYKSLLALWKATGRIESDFASLFNGCQRNVSLEVNEALMKIVDSLKVDSGAQLFLDGLEQSSSLKQGLSCSRYLEISNSGMWDQFLLEHGHVCSSWDFSKPSWGEDPKQLAPLIRVLMENQCNTREVNRQNESLAKANFMKVLLSLYGTKTVYRISRMFALVEQMIAIDEEQHYLTGKYVHPTKMILENVGRL